MKCAVEMQLRRGDNRNEMTRFRYDATLASEIQVLLESLATIFSGTPTLLRWVSCVIVSLASRSGHFV
jgi:hypothetical protein